MVPTPPRAPGRAGPHRPLAAMDETNDGFEIAERDLDIRGPGDYFGTRQWGEPLFRVANVLRDRGLFDLARREAGELLSSPATVEQDRIINRVIQTWGQRFGVATAGGGRQGDRPGA